MFPTVAFLFQRYGELAEEGERKEETISVVEVEPDYKALYQAHIALCQAVKVSIFPNYCFLKVF